jgi:hypothetical protein
MPIKKEYITNLCSTVNLIRIKHENNPWPYSVVYYKGYVNIEMRYNNSTVKLITTGNKEIIAAYLNGMINAYNNLNLHG